MKDTASKPATSQICKTLAVILTQNQESNGISRQKKMGQEICAIITKKNTPIENSIVHFVEDNFTVIPINLNYAVSFFIDNIGDFISINDYCAFLKTTDEYLNDKDEDKDEDEDEDHTLKTLIEIIETYKLNNFIIEYYSEWADIPEDNLCIAVINGEIKKQSIYKMWGEDNKDNINIEEFYDLIGADRRWIADENRYFNYRKAKKMYNQK